VREGLQTAADPDQSRGRRWFLTAAGTTAAAGAVAVLAPAAANAATPVARKVTQYVALKWAYNPKTKVTTVTKSRKITVTVRFVGSAIYGKNSKGAWVRIPYVWSVRQKALVYSQALQLALIAKPIPKPTPPPIPKPPATIPAGPVPTTVTSTSAYVGTSGVWHLARRASYGPTPTLIADITAAGPTAWLTQQLNPASINDSAFDAFVARYPHLNEEIWQTDAALNDRSSGENFGAWDAYMNVAGAHVARALWSKKHLLAVMEDFWSNHFNVNVLHDGTAPSRANYARMLRAGAFGKFSDLLYQVMTHPSMLIYLNNDDSDKYHPNENLGRELLELHTVGINAGYGETGVLNSARILTGLSVADDVDGGGFAYKPWMHWTGPVTVLGFTDPNPSDTGGLEVAAGYLNYLAHHPATAHFVCKKLAIRFVTDTPSETFIASLAAVYTANDTAIAPVLTALFTSTDFAANAGSKLHRPFERMAATVRILDYKPDVSGTDSPIAVWDEAGDTSNSPLQWEPPNGYPDVASAWTSTAATLGSWNARMNIIQQWWPNSMNNPPLTQLLPALTATTTYADLIAAVTAKLFGLPIATRHRDAILIFLGITTASNSANPTQVVDPGDDAVGWQLPYWIAVLLDSPYGTRR
jgi:uncharacterized protein (DUF1800 family)